MIKKGAKVKETFELKYSRKQPQAEKFCSIEKVRLKLLPKNILKSVLSFFPILDWLPKYNWKRDLNGDIIGGLTVGIMQVPQGMAYANLASLPPVYGMYTSFFTSTFYAFFGTSRHISIGAFAVASLMVGAVRLRFVPDPDIVFEVINGTSVEIVKPVASPVDFGYEVSPIMLTSTLAMTVGLFQLVMAMMGLAFLTSYMSDALISGFTTGSAFHVFTAQLNKIIGVKLPRYSGFGMLFFIIRDLMLVLPQANYWTLGISVSSIIFLSVGRDYVNPWLKKRSPVPLPIELILVILVTMFSVFMDLKNNHGVKIVDYIPQGVPKPSLPNFDLVPYLLNDAFAIAIISYMFVISMAKLFAKKRHYKIDPAQDLYAVGLMHTLSSFFPIFPAGGSLSRSAVCEQSGANTQLNILFSNALLLTVIAFIGPLLEPLPMCVLACIVIVSLRSLFMQFGELSKLWRISKFDFAVWLVSCIATVSFDVMTGLTISVLFTLISVVLREQRPNIFVLGRTAHREIYRPLIYYCGLKPVNENIEIIRFEAPLNFVTVSSFLDKMSDVLRDDANEDHELRCVKNDEMTASKAVAESNYEELLQREVVATNNTKEQPWYEIVSPGVVVVDCGAISNIDTMGIEAIKQAYLQGKEVNKTVLFANVSEAILDTFERIDFYSSVPKASFYPCVEEAVRTMNNNAIE
ncbi:sulfate permease [Loa loa]|uniref:Sulfate permease n=2 Tax=Loa loa TaxID=7209 RepID=A0A1S0U261_LOALO|nr:sulfate permease [Loa loa]EFO23948.1 sulfate permease [Loa loa]